MTTGEAATEAEYQGEWALILPQSWWQFPVHPLAAREKAIKAYAREQLGKSDEMAKVRQEIVSILRSQITDIEKHAQMFAVIKGETVGALMPASLVVSSYPVGSFLQSVLSPLLSVGETVAEESFPTPQGMIRKRQYTTVLPAAKTGADGDLTVTHLDFFVPTPDSKATLHLAFSTPIMVERAVEKMMEYFQLIASSLSFKVPDEFPEGVTKITYSD